MKARPAGLVRQAAATGATLKSLKEIGSELAGVVWSGGVPQLFQPTAVLCRIGRRRPGGKGSGVHEQGISKAGNLQLRTK
jgi:transposase